jgi:hypothetical protein
MKDANAIMRTLAYFDVQDRPLTLLEIHTYLLGPTKTPVTLSEIHAALETSLKDQVISSEGFYALKGREEIIAARTSNNFYSIPRMRRVNRFLPLARHVPFIRCAALSGSEALSTSKKGSDIDILLFTDPKRIWTARFFATFMYQLLGIRRHGKHIENRFCLNHYIAGIKRIENDNNLYTAVEYASLIAFYGGDVLSKFQDVNREWINGYIPNFRPIVRKASRRSGLQKWIEFFLNGIVGQLIENFLGGMQRRRIIAQSYITIERDELSFHPGSKGQQVLQRFAERSPAISVS